MLVALIASEADLPSRSSWGTGGWMAPEDREALDWLTLVRFLGWNVHVTSVNEAGTIDSVPAAARAVIVACDPNSLNVESVSLLASRLAEGRLLVARAGRAGSPIATLSRAVATDDVFPCRVAEWRGPGAARTWPFRDAFDVNAVTLGDDVTVWAAAAEHAIVAARREGSGTVVTLTGHPSRIRDAAPAGSALMTRVLKMGTPAPAAWLDFEHTLVLRMDDPGGAQNVYSREWNYPKLDAAAWSRLTQDLRSRGARISLGYSAGWVDDGDAERGRLAVGGESVSRAPGAVYPSPLVRYEDVAGHSPGTVHDYAAEFSGIQALRRAGAGDVEVHGFTHMHPDTTAWARAVDRYDTWPTTAWYRELGQAARPLNDVRPTNDHPITRALALFREYFDTLPTTLIPPGDQWTADTLERAHDAGLQLVASYYLAIRHGAGFCWAQHVCAPYLDRPDPAWFDSGLPVVGYFHDLEPSLHGVGWVTDCLDRWRSAGARRIVDFREIAAALALQWTVEERPGEILLTVGETRGPIPPRPVPVRVRAESLLPEQCTVYGVDGRRTSVPVQKDDDLRGRILLPPSAL